MLVCAAVALRYWIIFLRCYPLLRQSRKTPPEGLNAGELGVRLTLAGVDLTAMVFSWAQLGYLEIQLDDRGRVWFHKKTDMGNERSAFEVKTFQALFNRRDFAEGTGRRYAELAAHVRRLNPSRKTLNHPKCGNPLIFRFAMCGVMVFCGVCYAMHFTGLRAMQLAIDYIRHREKAIMAGLSGPERHYVRLLRQAVDENIAPTAERLVGLLERKKGVSL